MIRLEEFTALDFDRFIAWVKTEKFMVQFAGPVFTFPITREQLDSYVAAKNRKVYRVVNVCTNKVIGHAEIGKIDLENKNARLCRVLIGDVAHRGSGFGSMIINELLKISFGEFELHRIDLGVFDFNKAAISCYEKCGFKIEGLLRESFLIENTFHSVYNMSILKHEWKVIS